MTEPATPHVLVVTSAGASPAAAVPVLAAIEAAGMRVRAIDVGSAGAGGGGVADRVRRALLGESAERRLRKELETNPPDVAVAFDPHSTLALTVARDQVESPAPVVGVVADLDPVTEWRQTDADRFVAVDETAAVSMAELGVEADRILVVGAIGERAYADAAMEDRYALRSRFQLVGTPIVIEVAGLGAEAVGQLVMQLSLTQDADRMHFLFDAAGDAEVASVLRRQVPALGLRGKLFGQTADAPMLWRAAEVVVARPRPTTIARVLLVGAKLVVLDDGIGASQRVIAALEARRRAIGARSMLLVSGALEAALKGAAPPPLPDGADSIADVVWAVGTDKRGVVDERRSAARQATSQRVRAASAAADAVARVTAMPGEIEDLGGASDLGAAAAAASVPDAAELDRLRNEVKLRIGELTRSMMTARDAADRLTKEADGARARGETAEATAASRKADGERARMHALLGEMAALETQLKDLDRAAATAAQAPRPPPASASASARPTDDDPVRPPPPRTASLDDELAALKRKAQGGAAGPAPAPKPGSGARGGKPPAKSGVDDELAALKQKMAQTKKKTP